jgi:integrase
MTSHITLYDAAQAFLARYSNPTTRKGFERDLMQAVRWLGGDKLLSELHRLDIARYAGTITASDANNGSPYSPNTQRTKLKVLVTFLNWSYKHGLVTDKLSEIVQLPREPIADARDKAYTEAEIDKLIEYAEGRTVHSGRRLRDLALFLFCHDTGARVGSLAKMQRRHVDLINREATLWNTKRSRWYKVAFGVYTAQVMGEWFDVLPSAPTAYLWNSRSPGASMKPAALSQIPGRACDLLGIERHGVHGFRRGLGVRMVDAGVSIEYVADILNDSVPVAQKHYAPREIPAAKVTARKLAYQPPKRRKIRRFTAG